MSQNELQYSNKPEVLRLHELETNQRSKFCSNFSITLNELLPNSIMRKLRSSETLSRAIAVLPDLYYTFITTNHCKRRLGEEYTYIAMYKRDHYEYEGVLLNKKVRTLLTTIELISRHGVRPLLQKRLKEGAGGLLSMVVKYVGTGQEISDNAEWILLMLFMLDWTKRFTIIEKILGISYVYTYKNDQLKDVSYKIEGYLLLVALTVKAVKHLYQIYHEHKREKERKNEGRKVQRMEKEEGGEIGKEEGGVVGKGVLCRICYDQIKERSATKCGHVFCWTCIVKTVEMTEECPVCRTACLPREVVQLRNY